MKESVEQKLIMYMYNNIVKYVRESIDLAEKIGITNEQYFLDFLDRINKQSVRY